MNRILTALAVAAVAAFALPAQAGSAFKTFTVTAVVADNCTINAANITFASSYDPVVANLSTPLDGAGSVTVACTVGAVPLITLDDGSHSPAAGSRAMSAGSAVDLGYDLFSDNTFSSRWGSSAGQTVAPGAAISTVARVIPVYARIPANQQGVSAGTFTDTVKATVNF